ncbi:RRM_1 domain-containing protein/NTF2 domain-containing protein, partial [Cephalotus follicularis]
PQIVGNAFVEQYYNVIQQCPQVAYKFYQDSSVVSRPGPDGVMASVTTIEAIDVKILSLDYNNHTFEIQNVDSQLCNANGGVIVLVNGCLTGKDKLRRKFAQAFFLLPQHGGSSYFVLNDVFRYVDDAKEDVVEVATNEDNEKEEFEDVAIHEDNEKEEFEDVAIHEDDDHTAIDQEARPIKQVTETFFTLSRDPSKRSYASVVYAMKENTTPFKVVAPPPPKPKAVVGPSSSNNLVQQKDDQSQKWLFDFDWGNLPTDATNQLLAQIFGKFGTVEHRGTRVIKSSKMEGKCFGFVEFEHATSMQAALEACTTIVIG